VGFYQGQVKQSHFVTTVVVSGFTKYQPWHFSSAGATSHNEVVTPMVSKSDSRLALGIGGEGVMTTVILADGNYLSGVATLYGRVQE